MKTNSFIVKNKVMDAIAVRILTDGFFIAGLIANTLLSYRLKRDVSKVQSGVREMRRWQERRDKKDVRILMLDDDEDDRDLVKMEVLSQISNPYQLFKSQREFLDNIPAGRNVFIVDHFLDQNTSGVYITKRIKEKNRGNFVIAYCGTHNDQVFSDYVIEGIDRFVYKNNPDGMNLLKSALEFGITEVSS